MYTAVYLCSPCSEAMFPNALYVRGYSADQALLAISQCRELYSYTSGTQHVVTSIQLMSVPSKADNFSPSRSMGLIHHQNLGFSTVSMVIRVTVWITVSVRLRLRLSFNAAKLWETCGLGTGKISVLPSVPYNTDVMHVSVMLFLLAAATVNTCHCCCFQQLLFIEYTTRCDTVCTSVESF